MAFEDIIWEDGEKISKGEITEVEAILGIKFPNDFVNVILDNDGGMPNLTAIDFNNEHEKVFSGLLSMSKNSEYDYIIETFVDVKDRLNKGVIPFADDPFGNLYCFDYRRNPASSTIIYWDHELEPDDEDQFVFVADSFTDLLNRLYEPDEEDSTIYQISIFPQKGNFLSTVIAIKTHMGLNTTEAKQLAEREESIMILEGKRNDITKEVEQLKSKGVYFQIDPAW